MEEKAAIALLKQNDLRGLELLVLRYQVQAVHTAYLVVGDRPLAEDIVQSAFLRAAEKIDQFEDNRPFGPWFLRIVINAAIKASSRGKKQVSLDAAQEQEVAPTWLMDDASGPEELVDTAETRRAVWKALQQLTPKQRAAVVMRYFLDMKDREISRELDRPLTSIKWSIHAAKKRLLSLLGPRDAFASSAPPEGKRERGPGENR